MPPLFKIAPWCSQSSPPAFTSFWQLSMHLWQCMKPWDVGVVLCVSGRGSGKAHGTVLLSQLGGRMVGRTGRGGSRFGRGPYPNPILGPDPTAWAQMGLHQQCCWHRSEKIPPCIRGLQIFPCPKETSRTAPPPQDTACIGWEVGRAEDWAVNLLLFIRSNIVKKEKPDAEIAIYCWELCCLMM